MLQKLFLCLIIISMICSSQSAVLECLWNSDMTYCMPQNMTPVTQPNEVITINGQPSNYVNLNTYTVMFSNQVFNYIPSGLFTLFPNMQSLSLEKCETTTLMTDSIPSCTALTYFTLRGGTFTNIPAGVLQSCKSLTFLGFAENNATTVDADAFRGLLNLTTLHISYSKISCIPPGLFQYTPLLNMIGLNGNQITAIDANLFKNLPMLMSINLNHNLLSFIPAFNFSSTNVNSPSNSPYLYIDMSSNPIYAITPDFCSIFGERPSNDTNFQLSNISCIRREIQFPFSLSYSICLEYKTELQYCYSNWTSSMSASVPCVVQPTTTVSPTTVPPTTAVVTTPSPIPGSCPSDKICRYFLDQYNRYTCILDGVDSVLTSISGNHLITFADSNVRRVIFTNSFLSRIPPILFQKFTSLEYLTVSNCSMSAINTNTFTACGSLKYFDASSNFITTVDGASFKSCAALEVIDLTGNSFDMISGQLFVNNPTLKAVYINRPPAMVLV